MRSIMYLATALLFFCLTLMSCGGDDATGVAPVNDTRIQGGHKVLVEMFSNSHCPICAGVHSSIKAYTDGSQNADKVAFVYYHIPYPYSDDPLYQANTSQNNARNSFYGGASSTPRIYFDGVAQSSFSAQALNDRIAISSPFEITLSRSGSGTEVTVTASIKRTGDVPATDLVVHFIAVETVNYGGRNGVNPQPFVMRSMVNGASGEALSIGLGETKQVSKTVQLSADWSPNNVGIVVFIQSVGSRVIYQSEYLAYR